MFLWKMENSLKWKDRNSCATVLAWQETTKLNPRVRWQVSDVFTGWETRPPPTRGARARSKRRLSWHTAPPSLRREEAREGWGGPRAHASQPAPGGGGSGPGRRRPVTGSAGPASRRGRLQAEGPRSAGRGESRRRRGGGPGGAGGAAGRNTHTCWQLAVLTGVLNTSWQTGQ